MGSNVPLHDPTIYARLGPLTAISLPQSQVRGRQPAPKRAAIDKAARLVIPKPCVIILVSFRVRSRSSPTAGLVRDPPVTPRRAAYLMGSGA